MRVTGRENAAASNMITVGTTTESEISETEIAIVTGTGAGTAKGTTTASRARSVQTASSNTWMGDDFPILEFLANHIHERYSSRF